MNTCRCTVCNRTNNIEVCNTTTDFTTGPFFDTADGEVVCLDCYDSIYQTLDEFEEQLEFDFDAKESGDVKW